MRAPFALVLPREFHEATCPDDFIGEQRENVSLGPIC